MGADMDRTPECSKVIVTIHDSSPPTAAHPFIYCCGFAAYGSSPIYCCGFAAYGSKATAINKTLANCRRQ